MPYYETVIVLRQDLSTAQAERTFEEAQHIATREGGSISRSESWGLRNLSYQIRKNRKGHYFLFNHSSTLQSVAEMDRVLRLNEDVLRILTLRCDKAISAPSPLATTPKPPFSASETPEPPTASPPTVSPPTASPPTASPPTISPPTVSPPTAEPPTVSPPTAEPPTAEPPIEADTETKETVA